MKARTAQLRADAADLDLRARTPRHKVFVGASLLLMAVGITVSIVSYTSSLNASDPRDISSDVILAVAMLGVVVAGGVLFLYFALSGFMRLWLLRQLVDSQANAERVAAAAQAIQDAQPAVGTPLSPPSDPVLTES